MKTPSEETSKLELKAFLKCFTAQDCTSTWSTELRLSALNKEEIIFKVFGRIEGLEVLILSQWFVNMLSRCLAIA